MVTRDKSELRKARLPLKGAPRCSLSFPLARGLKPWLPCRVLPVNTQFTRSQPKISLASLANVCHKFANTEVCPNASFDGEALRARTTKIVQRLSLTDYSADKVLDLRFRRGKLLTRGILVSITTASQWSERTASSHHIPHFRFASSAEAPRSPRVSFLVHFKSTAARGEHRERHGLGNPRGPATSLIPYTREPSCV